MLLLWNLKYWLYDYLKFTCILSCLFLYTTSISIHKMQHYFSWVFNILNICEIRLILTIFAFNFEMLVVVVELKILTINVLTLYLKLIIFGKNSINLRVLNVKYLFSLILKMHISLSLVQFRQYWRHHQKVKTFKKTIRWLSVSCVRN